jgi:poly(A) polymerase
MDVSTTTEPASFRRVFQAGIYDDSHRLLGGTEVLHLVPHGGRLFCSLSYKLNAYLPEDPQTGAQIAVLDQPGGNWRLVRDYERAHWRVTLESVTFTEDGRGQRLEAPVSLLLAAPSDSRGTVYVDSRDDETGAWTRTHLGSGAGVASIRSFFVYRDKVTGLERVFAGTSPLGIFSGTYAAEVPGNIRWDDSAEMAGYTRRPMAFTECNGRLYVSIKPDIYRRIDGEIPQWEKVYTIPVPLIVPSSGLRGLTTVPRPSGSDQVLLAALEGDRCRVVRIDPEDSFRETVELEVLDFLGERWGQRPTYGVVAYDDFTPVADPETGRTLLFTGLGATYSTQLDTHPADEWVRDAWYLIRYPDGQRYELRRIESPDMQPMPQLVAARSITVSPFEPGMLYIGGYDPNAKPCRQTAWVFSASIEASLAPQSQQCSETVVRLESPDLTNTER